MLKIELAYDAGPYDRAIDSYDAAVLQAGMVDAVNRTASAVAEALRRGMLDAFDRPKPFTVAGVRTFKATPRYDGGDPSALVFLADTQAAYLELEIFGGDRVAGDVATTKLGPLVPGPAAPRDAFGNLPRGYIAQAVQEPDVAWITLKAGEPPALVRTGRDGRLEILALIVEREHYDEKFDFYGIAEQTALEVLPGAVRDAFSVF